MRWSILTPELSIHWDGRRLSEGPGATRADAPSGDPLEETWRTYYAEHLQPGAAEGRRDAQGDAEEILAQHAGDFARSAADRRLRGKGAEMIHRVRVQASAARGGRARCRAPIEPGGNLRASWEALLKDARKCTRCDLYKYATQTVFGEGPLDAGIMFVGEQPGDQEDLAGRPFVGPAGAVVRRRAGEGRDRPRRPSTSPTRSSISNSSSAASDASTTSPTPARSRPAAGGSSTSAS